MRITYKMRSYIPRRFEKLRIYVTIQIKIVVFVPSVFSVFFCSTDVKYRISLTLGNFFLVRITFIVFAYLIVLWYRQFP